jgi:hypothetical protein
MQLLQARGIAIAGMKLLQATKVTGHYKPESDYGMRKSTYYSADVLQRRGREPITRPTYFKEEEMPITRLKVAEGKEEIVYYKTEIEDVENKSAYYKA